MNRATICRCSLVQIAERCSFVESCLKPVILHDYLDRIKSYKLFTKLLQLAIANFSKSKIFSGENYWQLS